eukprot:scaffold4522_cov145-Skeletonema_marinoi.AAC.11
MAASEEEYNALTCVQLRAICKERGLVQKGVKKVIVDRLMKDDKASTPAAAPTPTQAVHSSPQKEDNEEEDIGIILGSPTKVLSSSSPVETPVKSPAPAASASSIDNNDQEFQDETHTCHLFEGRSKYLSPSGLHFIANHQYRPSEYTHLDNLLNPFWTYLTECLPLWLAPNMVTTLGGMHCALAYGVMWYYCPDFDTTPPDWVVMLAGYCAFAYYTLDCMDGKQARRTGSSSPLGQLFDHGFDCICTLFFVATFSSYLEIGGTHWYNMLQTSLQFAFFMAQWEEYHTLVLPHNAGKWCGVTEVNYASALGAICVSLIDREAFFQKSMEDTLAPLGLTGGVVKDMELRHFLLCGWGGMSLILMGLSLKRTLCHPRIAGEDMDASEIRFNRINALSKLASPFLLCVAAFIVPPEFIRTRYLSVVLGCALSLLTKKMIVFSMAKMPYAIIQTDIFPFIFAAIWIRYDTRLTKEGGDFVFGVLSIWYAYRLLRWVNVAINQICAKLGIYCFRLKKRDD